VFLCAVGNKDDNDRKVVSPSDARRLADQVGIPFFETSAKENKNVEEVGDGCDACFRSRNLVTCSGYTTQSYVVKPYSVAAKMSDGHGFVPQNMTAKHRY